MRDRGMIFTSKAYVVSSIQKKRTTRGKKGAEEDLYCGDIDMLFVDSRYVKGQEIGGEGAGDNGCLGKGQGVIKGAGENKKRGQGPDFQCDVKGKEKEADIYQPAGNPGAFAS